MNKIVFSNLDYKQDILITLQWQVIDFMKKGFCRNINLKIIKYQIRTKSILETYFFLYKKLSLEETLF